MMIKAHLQSGPTPRQARLFNSCRSCRRFFHLGFFSKREREKACSGCRDEKQKKKTGCASFDLHVFDTFRDRGDVRKPIENLRWSANECCDNVMSNGTSACRQVHRAARSSRLGRIELSSVLFVGPFSRGICMCVFDRCGAIKALFRKTTRSLIYRGR